MTGVKATQEPQSEEAATPLIDGETRSLIDALLYLAGSVHKTEYAHLETALHDVRHQNAAIVSHAESLMADHGFRLGDEWDMQSINRDSALRHAMSIFCAARDLTSALDLHEISRNPSSAEGKPTLKNIHKLFFREKQIVAPRLDTNRLVLELRQFNVEMELTQSFMLIPKILIDNAIKYSARGGKIIVSVVETPSSIRVICTNSGELIKQQEQDLVFRRQVRGANSQSIPGSGLGLWLAKTIVEANRGTISLTIDELQRDAATKKSTGTTTVTIVLPRQNPALHGRH